MGSADFAGKQRFFALLSREFTAGKSRQSQGLEDQGQSLFQAATWVAHSARITRFPKKESAGLFRRKNL
jgi:hypothetical protein